MKIAFFANDDFYLYRYRLNLMKALVKSGHQVTACGLATDKDFVLKIKEAGIAFKSLDLKRGIRLISSFVYFFQVYHLCRRENFDLCHNFSFKPTAIASLAQKLAGTSKIFFSVTGLGFVYYSQSLKARLLKPLANLGYLLAGKIIDGAVFQNGNDLKRFVDNKLIKPEKAFLIQGSGVDTKFFSKKSNEFFRKKREELKIAPNKKVIFMVGRLLKSKGVLIFCQAAEVLAKKHRDWFFVLAGPIDKVNPEGIEESEIRKWEDDAGVIKYLGERRDVQNLMAISDCFVFPSYYAEGLPRVVLEAMSIELPVIVAENNGLEGVVDDRENGIIIPPKNVEKLIEAIEAVLFDNSLAKSLGAAARKKVLENFSDEIIIKKTMEMYKL